MSGQKRNVRLLLGWLIPLSLLVIISLPILAAPPAQFPTATVLVISDPAPPEPSVPGQFPERTLLQAFFADPGGNTQWRNRGYNDSAWNLSSVMTPNAGWGTDPLGDPTTLAEFIWQEDPANPGFIPATPAPQQFLFLRKSFCIPINANTASIIPNGNLSLQIAASPGDASVYVNGFPVQTGVGTGNEAQTFNIDVSSATYYRGQNVLALRVQDNVADLQAAVAYSVEYGYSINAGAISINAPASSTANTPSAFSESNDGLSSNAPYTYAWNFGDGSPIDTASAPSHTYTTPGSYTISLVMSDNFGCPSAPVTIQHTVLAAPPSSVTITGPASGNLNTSYGFTADVLPATASTPLTYTWQATDLGTVIQSNNLADNINFTWTSYGTKTITVWAENAAGVVSDTHTIYIQPDALSGVTISGPTSGLSNMTYNFTADVTPINVSLPISYSWQSGGGTPASVTNSANSASDTQGFSWATAGTYTLTITANNPAGIPMVDTHVIVISDPIIAPISLSVSGPTAGVVNSAYTFDATVSPVTTTIPITYDWQVTDLGSFQTPASNAATDQMNFTWATPGVKVIDVTASNAGGSVMGSHSITLTVNIVAPASVSVTGPTAGVVNSAYTFDATVSPATTTTPITYNWQVTDLGSFQTPASSAATDQMNFTWASAGVKTIDVSAINSAGSVVGSHNITINLIGPGAVTISGPVNGVVNTTYTFNAAVSPANVSLPLTYIWQATDQTSVTRSVNATSDTLPFSWSSTGVKTIIVEAQNSVGTVVGRHTITIDVSAIAPTAVNLSGPTTGQTGQSRTFNAAISPANASSPISYIWQADGQTTVTTVDVSSINFTWNNAGTYNVSVTASNAASKMSAGQARPPVSDSMSIVIRPKDDDDDDDDDDDNAAPAPAPAPVVPTATPNPAQFPKVLPETGQSGGGGMMPFGVGLVALLLGLGVMIGKRET